MPTKMEAYEQVMSAILADPDRSIEGTIARGIQAGIALERERIRAILDPAPAGLEKSAIVLALSGDCSLEAALHFFAMHEVAPTPVTAAEVRARRSAFKLIENEQTTEECHAREAP
jgi:hypothetical protein